jgi:ABC-2 type transport system ATP-binding protein
MHTLELKNVNSGYNKKPILHNINFKANESSIYVVLGPNGAGKTTLFRTIAGILEPYSGEILLDNENINSSTDQEMRKRINYLSHYDAIPEEMTVYNALKFYEDMEGGNADNVIDILDLDELKNKKVVELSQGQKKRVSIAKVFLRERDIYLLDEPTANLDPAISKKLRDIILKLSKNKIVLYSSHNLYEASDIGGNLILIKNGTIGMSGRISDIKSKGYRVGIKATKDISKIIDAKLGEGGYYILNVSSPAEAGLALKKLVKKGIIVTEMRRLDNPLQELFEKGMMDNEK